MNANILKLVACLAWAGAAVASATPANALALTVSTGTHATCSGSYQAGSLDLCGLHWSYSQTIKFQTTTCNSGSCALLGTTSTENPYSYGRKTTSEGYTCMAEKLYHIYELSICAC